MFHSAISLETAERYDFLARACGGDESLRKDVELLIASHEKSGSFIDSPALLRAGEPPIGEESELKSGQRIGPYEVISLLGRGGMGEVYLALDERLHRKVALKLLPAFFIKDKERVERFKREARAASGLNHPNIITIHEIGEIDSQQFITTEFIEGETLRERLFRRHLTLNETLNVAIQIADALSAAHKAGIIHRDIKPENIMVRPDGYVKVLDFGLAKLAEASSFGDSEAPTKVNVKTAPGLVMGTASYMSPEQSRASAQVDHRTDIWSLGVVLYEMVAGRLPFEGKDIHRQVIAIQDEEARPLSMFAENVPERLEEIVSKALAKDPEERYQTAKDFLIDLRNLKRKLEIDALVERTSAPWSGSEVGGLSGAKEVVSKAQRTASQTTTVAQAQPTSSAEYIVNQIKQHKRGAALTSLLLFLIAVSVGAYFLFIRGTAKTINSVAVLPFVNTGGDANTEYLSDGVTESLINSLSQIPNLNVKSRDSVFRYKGREVDASQVGRELGVQAVLTGRLVQRGDAIWISLELVDVGTNNHLWGAQYNRTMSDIMALQDEIAKDVSAQLHAKLSGEDSRRLTRRYTDNSEAYQLYLKGRYFLNKHTAETVKLAINYFQQAIDRDPTFALAYAGLADSYKSLPYYGISVASPRDSYPKAKAAALKALEQDDSLAEAHASLANIEFEYEWNWESAEREFKRALELNTNDAATYRDYGSFLDAMGRFDEAEVEIKRAQQLDPLSVNIALALAETAFFSHQYDKALTLTKQALELDPNFPPAHASLANIYAMKGMYDKSPLESIAGLSLSGYPLEDVAALRAAFESSGTQGFWREWINQSESRLKRGEYVPAMLLATLYTRLEERDKAFYWFNKAFEDRNGGLAFIKVSPLYDSIRSDPRFQELMRRVGLPQ